ncbi:uncharacterized protein LOC119766811 isoform X2 [Culex quinquefasciatus]|uniref:uncharacterized protein LOC119766811 isoform X2 n=1 Tax=Culex quinquefasciatus TaxID=7176 RepID=UPI0018E39765|nr:uncharacterized protein LOC119766811 isoform X2 [Culex quinquefasciatus]
MRSLLAAEYFRRINKRQLKIPQSSRRKRPSFVFLGESSSKPQPPQPTTSKRRREHEYEDSDDDSDFYGFAAESSIFEDDPMGESSLSDEVDQRQPVREKRPIRRSTRQIKKKHKADFKYF